MPFTEIERQRIKRDLEPLTERMLAHQKEEDPGLDYLIGESSIDIFYTRITPTGDERTGVARIEFDVAQQLWILYWQRNDLKWCEYRPLKSSAELSKLVAEICRDIHGYFFWRTGAAQKREIER